MDEAPVDERRSVAMAQELLGAGGTDAGNDEIVDTDTLNTLGECQNGSDRKLR